MEELQPLILSPFLTPIVLFPILLVNGVVEPLLDWDAYIAPSNALADSPELVL